MFKMLPAAPGTVVRDSLEAFATILLFIIPLYFHKDCMKSTLFSSFQERKLWTH